MKKNEQKQAADASKPDTVDKEKKDEKKAAPAVDVNLELDKLAEIVGTEVEALSQSSGLSPTDICSQLVARIRHSSRRVAAAPVRHSSGAQFQPPPR